MILYLKGITLYLTGQTWGRIFSPKGCVSYSAIVYPTLQKRFLGGFLKGFLLDFRREPLSGFSAKTHPVGFTRKTSTKKVFEYVYECLLSCRNQCARVVVLLHFSPRVQHSAIGYRWPHNALWQQTEIIYFFIMSKYSIHSHAWIYTALQIRIKTVKLKHYKIVMTISQLMHKMTFIAQKLQTKNTS